jgi:hypothetical protein
MIKINKTWLGSYKISLFGTLAIVIGTGDSWGIGIEYSHYDKALSLKILPWYIIFEPDWDNLG